MKLYSKLVFICNLCFCIMVPMRYIEIGRRANGAQGEVIPLQFVEGTIVLLGWFAILLNAAFVFIILFRKSTRRIITVPKWLIWFNFIVFGVQIWYHFFSA